MKKISLIIAANFLIGTTFAAPGTPTPPPSSTQTINPVVLQQLIQLQKQQLTLQKAIIQMQQKQLKLQMNLLTQKQTPVTDKFKWIPLKEGAPLPKHLLNAGLENSKPIYVCHAKYQNFGVHPGRYTNKGCLISYGGKAFTLKKYAVLTSTENSVWKSSQNLYRMTFSPFRFGGIGPVGIRPANSNPAQGSSKPIIGGYEKSQSIYICRVLYHNQLFIGKAANRLCYISVNGKEVYLNQYDVLFTDPS